MPTRTNSTNFPSLAKHGRDFGPCIGANFGVLARSLVHFGAGGVGWLQTEITLFG
jgi:hypothetical protein